MLQMKFFPKQLLPIAVCYWYGVNLMDPQGIDENKQGSVLKHGTSSPNLTQGTGASVSRVGSTTRDSDKSPLSGPKRLGATRSTSAKRKPVSRWRCYLR